MYVFLGHSVNNIAMLWWWKAVWWNVGELDIAIPSTDSVTMKEMLGISQGWVVEDPKRKSRTQAKVKLTVAKPCLKTT